MEAYPLRLRRRIIELYEQGKQTHEIAGMLGTCKSGTRRIRQVLRERNTLEPLRPRTGYPGGLNDERAGELRRLVAADPDATREELRQRLNVAVDVRTIGRWLSRLGLVLKKSRCTPQNRSGRTWPSSVAAGMSS
jgi:transposase